LSFFFNSHNHLLEEVAKFRAARKIWATTLKEKYGAKDPNSLKLRFHAQTAGSMLTAKQPQNNIMRVTIQALAAVLGGAQSLHTNGFDEALSLPTESAARLALRTQQLIAYESGAADVADPFGGSFAIEELTQKLVDAAQSYLGEIEKRGGMIACIESGYVQKEIQEAAYRTQLAMDQGDLLQVGVNCFMSDETDPPELLHLDLSMQNKQIARLKKFKANRDKKSVERGLAQLAQAAKDSTNLMPAIISAVKANCTLGEVSDCLRKVFGTHHEIPTI
jgi:methylmalonyl-CoA mutase N-terminal domain/subunit